MSMNQERHFGMEFAQRGISRERHLHHVAHAAHVHEHLVRSFFGEPSAKLANHRSPVLPLFFRPSTQTRVKEYEGVKLPCCNLVGRKLVNIVLEQKINAFFGDAESTGLGTVWWRGILSAFFGVLSFGGVLCLHFPRLLSSPELRPHYPMHTMRVLIQCLIVGAILFGVISSILRKKKILEGLDFGRGLFHVDSSPSAGFILSGFIARHPGH